MAENPFLSLHTERKLLVQESAKSPELIRQQMKRNTCKSGMMIPRLWMSAPPKMRFHAWAALITLYCTTPFQKKQEFLKKTLTKRAYLPNNCREYCDMWHFSRQSRRNRYGEMNFLPWQAALWTKREQVITGKTVDFRSAASAARLI